MDGKLLPVEGCPPLQRNINDLGPHHSTKKSKRGVLFFEVEILDAKTREKLCFLDKVRVLIWEEGCEAEVGFLSLWSCRIALVLKKYIILYFHTKKVRYLLKTAINQSLNEIYMKSELQLASEIYICRTCS